MRVAVLLGVLVLWMSAGTLLVDTARTTPAGSGPLPAAGAQAGPAGATGATTTRSTDATPATSVPCRPFGFSAPSSWNEPGVDLGRTMESAVAAGARSVRIGIEWDRIESTRGVRDWSGADRVVDAARAYGLTVVALLHTTPEWARDPALTPSNRHTPPGRVADYTAFVAAAAERYGDRVLAWEVWNEPNIADFWFPRADPAAYAELLRATYPVLKAATPEVPVIAGALAPSPDTPWSYSPEVYLSALYRADVRGSFDALSHHPYPDPQATRTASGDDAGTWAPVRLTHQIMTNNGDGAKQIWVTEFGSPTGSSTRTVSPERQAELMADAVRAVSDEEWLGPLYLYTVRDESDRPSDRESNFGIYRHDWSPKPAVAALSRVARARDCG